MFLSMLTGDAAASHGHEFSRPTTPSQDAPQPRRRLPLRTPLSFLPYARQRSPHGPSPLGPGRSSTLPSRSKSVRVTMAELREEPDEEIDADELLKHLRMPGAFHNSFSEETVQASSTSTSPESVQTRSLSLEPEHVVPLTPTPLPTPILSSAPQPTAQFVEEEAVLPIKRVQRPKTCMRFAHPPPPTRPLGKKGILRPRVLLQLQQKSDSGFHKPMYDVLPASRFAPVTKIGQKLQRLRKERDGLAADDLVVLKAEDYKASDAQSEEVDISDARDVLGIICSIPGEPDSAMISLESGMWKASTGANGVHTLVLQGEHSQTARWYIPRAKRRNSTLDMEENRKFYFVKIDPSTTKHPTIASMTSSSIDVHDDYVTKTDPEEIIATDDLLRRLIIVSGLWLFFREGWSSNYKFDTLLRPAQNRAVSMPLEPTRRRSTFCRSPGISPSRPIVDENASGPVYGAGHLEVFTPPIPSTSPVSMSLAASLVQSDNSSFLGSDQMMAQTNGPNTTEHPLENSQPILPLTRAATDLDVWSQKRQSWNSHDLTSFNWQSATRSISRRMSTNRSVGPRNVAFLDQETTVTFKPSAPAHEDHGNRVGRLRRLSHSIRRPNSTRTHMKDVDFGEIEQEVPLEVNKMAQLDETMEETPALVLPILPVTDTSTIQEGQEKFEIDIVPAVRVTTPIPNRRVTSEPVVPTPPEKSILPPDRIDPIRSISLPITPSKGPQHDSPMESTDNLISAVRYTYWQQFDRLLERQNSPMPTSFPTSPTPMPQLERRPTLPPTLHIKPLTPVAPNVETPKTPVHTYAVERKPTWKEKLKHKFHHV
ncbi:hypothetical protein EJ08DRAFT_646383 [Tothia fuscella]|uniref:Uncharacterized protein n=1 Tax=Tothia fuscella TaxID=1048955 RepID=A0A9P4NZ99_9PEZI|nr:hypothetical protein EJ08DRAFT_646383 [Tothia fuscella]